MAANFHSLSPDNLAKMAAFSAAALRAAVEERNLPAVQACLGQLPAEQAAIAAKTQGLLLQAAERGFVPCVQWLLQSQYGGVDEAEPLSGCSALHRAAAVNQAACVATLLAAGAAPNSRDALQRTPLHLAVAAGAVDSVVVLLKAGADLLALDDMERSAADMLAAAEAAADDSGAHADGAAAAADSSGAALHGDALQVISALLVKELQSAVDAIRAAGMEVPPALLKALEAAATGGTAGSGAGAADAALAAATLRAAELTASVAGSSGGGAAAAGVGAASAGLPRAAPSRRMPWSVSNRLGAAAGTGGGSADASGSGGGLRRVNTLRDVAEATGDGEAPISGIMDVDVLLALLVTKFQASVDQGLVADYSEIYRVLDSAGDNRCSAGDLASGCLEMGIDIAPELLPAVLERMTGREGAETMACDEFTAFCDVAAEAAAAVAAAGDGDEEGAGDRSADDAGDAKEGEAGEDEEVIALPRSA
jgi:hypothetical protein